MARPGGARGNAAGGGIGALRRGPPGVRAFGPVNTLGVTSLLGREMVREWRFFGVSVLGPALQASLFAAVFTLAAGGDIERIGDANGLGFFAFLAPGLVISAMMQRAFQSTAYTLMFDKLEAELPTLLSAPMTAGEVLAGWILSSLAIAGAIGVTVALAMALFGMGAPVHWAAMVYFALTAMLLFSATGIIASILSQKWDGLSGKETFVLIPLIFLSGTFFPITAVPEGIWRTIFQANPVYYFVDGFRYAMTGRSEADPLLSAAIAAAVAAIVLVAAWALFRSGYKIKA